MGLNTANVQRNLANIATVLASANARACTRAIVNALADVMVPTLSAGDRDNQAGFALQGISESLRPRLTEPIRSQNIVVSQPPAAVVLPGAQTVPFVNPVPPGPYNPTVPINYTVPAGYVSRYLVIRQAGGNANDFRLNGAVPDSSVPSRAFFFMFGVTFPAAPPYTLSSIGAGVVVLDQIIVVCQNTVAPFDYITGAVAGGVTWSFP